MLSIQTAAILIPADTTYHATALCDVYACLLTSTTMLEELCVFPHLTVNQGPPETHLQLEGGADGLTAVRGHTPRGNMRYLGKDFLQHLGSCWLIW